MAKALLQKLFINNPKPINTMKQRILTMLFIALSSLLAAQNQGDSIPTQRVIPKPLPNRPMNNLHLNFLADATLFSLNYERLVRINDMFLLGARVGIGYNAEFNLCVFPPCTGRGEGLLALPHHIRGYIGRRQHFAVVGIGGTYLRGATIREYIFYPTAGYKFIPLRENMANFGVVLEFPFSPSGIYNGRTLFIPVGVNVGISF